jgi:tetratricopeptide (TPR) repeat protein
METMANGNNLKQKLDHADELLKQGKLDEAIEWLEVIRQKHSDEEPVLLRLAWAYWDNGNKERSIASWEILLDRELQRKIFTGFAYDELVRIYKQEGEIEKLVATCEKANRVQPQDVGLLEELGKAYLHSGQHEKACDIFKKLTSMESDNSAFFCRLGEALLNAGKIETGEDAYRRAGFLDPEETDRYLFQAVGLHINRNDFMSAKRLLTECLAIAPSNSLYYCCLGDICVALNELADAFAQYEKACQSNQHHTAAYWNRLGNSLMKAGWFADAARAFEKALTFDESAPCRQKLEEAYKAASQQS